ncbi:MAG: hypothetical protein A3A86_08275 [Elusimicrobia bacterium RIFCSPLOWO2_01_FULL_60_11]|nr:MAG: hypothetical protein A3A86_08275 [Elusimicrobia bacterium RIFCSPLOWO2_01_FULL_60_11]
MRGGPLAALAALFLAVPGSSQELTVPELQRKIREQDKTLSSAQFEYVQEMRSSQSPEVVRSKGRAYYRKPQMLRIEQESPERQIIVTRGKDVFIHTPRFNQVLKDSWKNWSRKNSFLPGLFGSSGTLERLEKDYTWKMENSEDLNGEETVVVRLKSAVKGAGDGLTLWLGAGDFVPRKALVESEGWSLATSLLSLKLNTALDPGLFIFALPRGAAVIKVP